MEHGGLGGGAEGSDGGAADGGIFNSFAPGGGLAAGATMPCHGWEEGVAQSWCPSDGTQFNVRMGPNYKKTGTKAPSAPSFYQCVGIDNFSSPSKINHIAERVQLPPVPEGSTGLPLPPFLVVNVQMPHQGPSARGKKGDGVGSSFVYYFALTPSTIEQLQGPPDGYTPALKILCRYLARCESDPKIKGHFKVIALCTNPQDVGLKQLMSKYNGKPVLINKTGSIFRGESYLEMDVNVHAFTMMTRKSLKETHSSLSKMKVLMGFVIQGQEDNELPEQIFGCAYLNCVDFTKAVPFPA